jgi:hypothetical protein
MAIKNLLLLFLFIILLLLQASICSEACNKNKELDFKAEMKKIPLYKMVLVVFFIIAVVRFIDIYFKLHMLGDTTISTTTGMLSREGYLLC